MRCEAAGGIWPEATRQDPAGAAARGAASFTRFQEASREGQSDRSESPGPPSLAGPLETSPTHPGPRAPAGCGTLSKTKPSNLSLLICHTDASQSGCQGGRRQCGRHLNQHCVPISAHARHDELLGSVSSSSPLRCVLAASELRWALGRTPHTPALWPIPCSFLPDDNVTPVPASVNLQSPSSPRSRLSGPLPS